jgi:tetratricopeptide (TPR) repeat protein
VVYLLLLFVAGRCLVPMDETDLFFNLRLGEIVLSTGHVPTENLLSFTYPAATDINLAWLFQIVLALAHRAAGIPGTVLLKTGFVLGTWVLLFRVAVKRGAHPALAALTLALAAWSAEPRFVERPHLVTFLGLALLLLALERAEAGRPRLLWLLIPIGLLWANANSCFFLAPAILLLYAAGARLDGERAHSRRALRVGLALVPLMFATPSGTRCLSYIANHIRMPWLRPLQEYRTARWPLDGPFFFLAAGLASAMATSIVLRKARLALPLRVGFPLIALAALGAFRIRFVAEFSILAGPALAVAASRLLPGVSGRVLTWSAAAALLALTVFPRAQAAWAGSRLFDIGLEADLVPEAAIAFVDRHGLRTRMYNDLEVGSYLTWQGWPRFRVFQDPRINGYPEAFHAILRRSDLSRAQWQRLLDDFSVDAALLTYPSVNPRGAWFDSGKWALVYRASDGLVFTRRLPERAALIAELEIPLSFSYAPTTGLQPVPLQQEPPEAALPACEWQRRLGDFFRSVGDDRATLRSYQSALAAPTGACLDSNWQASMRQTVGAVALQRGELAQAAALLDGLLAPEARNNHGFALLGLGRATSALADFDAVLVALPADDDACFGRGLALEALGRRAEAAAAFRQLLARSPNHLSAPVAREHLRRLQN